MNACMFNMPELSILSIGVSLSPTNLSGCFRWNGQSWWSAGSHWQLLWQCCTTASRLTFAFLQMGYGFDLVHKRSSDPRTCMTGSWGF